MAAASTAGAAMSDPIEALILDLLESLVAGPRVYSEVMGAWRTSCPRLPVWEEANDRGFIGLQGASVVLTPAGQEHLAKHRGR
jgi:D-3-phosphoglycerate dehydrogenase